MRQPPSIQDSAQPNHLWHMVKALYGLKQAPRAWHAPLCAALHDHGFVPLMADMSLFMFHHLEVIIYLLVYVDDIKLVSSSVTAAS
jgi:hypothetical protein